SPIPAIILSVKSRPLALLPLLAVYLSARAPRTARESTHALILQEVWRSTARVRSTSAMWVTTPSGSVRGRWQHRPETTSFFSYNNRRGIALQSAARQGAVVTTCGASFVNSSFSLTFSTVALNASNLLLLRLQKVS